MSERSESVAMLLEPAASARLGLVVPEPCEFEALVAAQATSDGLRDLRQAVAAWQAIAEKCDLAFEEVLKLSTYRLQVERALGSRLAREVKRGGRRSRSPERTLTGGLPVGVTKQQAARYRQLAAVPDVVFDEYLQVSKDRRRLPSSAGARRFCTPNRESVRRRGARPRRSAGVWAMDPAIADFVDRLMDPDVVVGPAVIRGAVHYEVADIHALAKARGNVLASACPDPAGWLPRLRQMHDSGVVSQVLVMLVAEPWAEWFRQALIDGWAFCLFSPPCNENGIGALMAHFGAKRAAFGTAARTAGRSCVRHV